MRSPWGTESLKGEVHIKKILVVAVLTVLGLALLLSGSVSASPSRHALVLGDGARTRRALIMWSSGWLDIAQGQTLVLTHNFGGDPDDYAVDLWCYDADSGGIGVNQRGFGGMVTNGRLLGAAWQRLTATSIEVLRLPNDECADKILVRIWIPDTPKFYDSGWVELAASQGMTLTHNVGGNPEDYTVGMRFRDPAPGGAGANLRAAGGLQVGDAFYGAFWSKLTDTTIQVFRFHHDTFAPQVRLTIYRPDPPSYDSGWQTVRAGSGLTLAHNLGGNVNAYVIRTSTKDTTASGYGINNLFGGGHEASGMFLMGSDWEGLTNSAITLFRQPWDFMAHTADQMRVWMWGARKVFLPIIATNVRM